MLEGGPDCPCDIIDFSDPEGSLNDFQNQSTRQFDDAKDRLEVVCQKHCTQRDLLTRRGVGYGTPLAHDPEVEHITKIDLKGAAAIVETETIDGRYSGFEYTLIKLNREWRISKIQMFLSKEEAPERRDWSDLPTKDAFSAFDDANIDFQKAFQAKGEVTVLDSQGMEKLSLVRLGELDVPSGYLAVVDPSNMFDKPRPLEVRLEKRRYCVELVRAGVFGVFVRVVFGDFSKAEAFVPARWIGDGDEFKPASVGTRGGYVFVVDAELWTGLSEREVERFSRGLYDEAVGPAKEGLRKILGSKHSGVLIERGGGDYDCPIYWAIDNSGAPQALVIDLKQCGEFVDQSFDFAASERLVETSQSILQMTEFGIHIRFRREGDQIAVLYKSDGGLDVDLIDNKNRMVSSTERSGLHTSEDDERVQYIPSVPENLDGYRFRCRWCNWQHAFARF